MLNKGGNETNLRIVEKSAKEASLSFNVNKTKIMVQFRCDTYIEKEMKIGGDMTEGVDEFVCLVACITTHTHELKVIRRIRLAKNNIASYSQ